MWKSPRLHWGALLAWHSSCVCVCMMHKVSADRVLQDVPLLHTAARVAYSTARHQGMPASNSMARTHTAISSENLDFCSGQILAV